MLSTHTGSPACPDGMWFCRQVYAQMDNLLQNFFARTSSPLLRPASPLLRTLLCSRETLLILGEFPLVRSSSLLINSHPLFQRIASHGNLFSGEPLLRRTSSRCPVKLACCLVPTHCTCTSREAGGLRQQVQHTNRPTTVHATVHITVRATVHVTVHATIHATVHVVVRATAHVSSQVLCLPSSQRSRSPVANVLVMSTALKVVA